MVALGIYPEIGGSCKYATETRNDEDFKQAWQLISANGAGVIRVIN